MTLDGCLLVQKDSGLSSFGVIERLQRILIAKTGLKKRELPKFGHGGTLDPFATGLLIVCMGEGTKLSRYFLGSTKEYRGVIRFGETTLPGDPTEPVNERSERLPQSLDEIQRAAVSFCVQQSGEPYLQTPPMHSAKKIDGQRLYELAREGKEIPRDPVECRIDEFKLSDYRIPRANYVARVSAGTYIRVLGQDLGRRLGSVAMLETLERTSSGKFHLSQALSLEAIERSTVDHWSQLSAFIPLTRMMEGFSSVTLSKTEALHLRQGRVSWIETLSHQLRTTHATESIVAIQSEDGSLVGVFSKESDGTSGFRLDRVFNLPLS